MKSLVLSLLVIMIFGALVMYVDKGGEKIKGSEENLTLEERDFLLKLSRDTLESYIKSGKVPEIEESKLTERLKEKKGVFVTLKERGELRGCIGYIMPKKPLYQAVIDNTINAAVHDPRFYPVRKDELADIKIEISVLTVPKKLEYKDYNELLNKLVPMRDGVILKRGFNEATYLPQVWEQIPDKIEFLSRLCIKAGMESNCWKDSRTEVYIYHAEVFGEE